MVGVATFATLGSFFTLLFFIALPGPDGFGGPLVVTKCGPGTSDALLTGTGLFGQCETSIVALVVDVVVVTSIFLALARLAGPAVGTTSALGALLVVLVWGYLAAGARGDRLAVWTGCLVIGTILGFAYSRLPRGGRAASA